MSLTLKLHFEKKWSNIDNVEQQFTFSNKEFKWNLLILL